MSKLLENKIKVKEKINNELEFLNYNPFHKGTIYLCETIYELYLLKDYPSKLSSDIYPIIAKKYNTTIDNIKTNIFRASLSSYYECDENKLSTYIGRNIIGKPSTLTIIEAILKHIK